MFKGQLLSDRYEIVEPIGGGGMANVYLARDTILKRDVAIKVLRLEYANDEEFIARFHREAQSAISLAHPHIVDIYDVGEEDDIYYMVMEFVNGMTLKKYIQNYGPIPVDQALDILKQLTDAISHAHENGIIHRDIKPQNILIDRSLNVKVTDFGIAMALSATSLTQTNSVLGSVHYLSPEQARGGMATKKSDIYSLGIVLFELLTGRLPFSGQSAVSIALKHLQSETPSVRRWNPNVPQSVENIVLKATAKDPFHRYESIQEMEKDIESSLLPERMNEPKFAVPHNDDDEVTKAIPIITNDTFKDRKTDDTIVHTTNHGKGSPRLSKQEKKAKRRFRPWLLSIVLILIVAGIAALFALPKLFIPADVEIVDVTGMNFEEAFNELSSLHLKVERETMNSQEIPEGHVIKTEPEAGMVVKEGATITVYSSLGKEKVEFKDYLHKSFDQIERLLKDELGYKDVIAYPKISEQPVGEIITQIQPKPGEKVIPEETTVIFEISNGPPKVTVQPLKGKTEEEIRTYINSEDNLSFNLIREFSDDVPEGTVIKQDPEGYTEVPKGSVVDVYISKGPEIKPPVTKKVSFTVELNKDSFLSSQLVSIYIDDLNHDINELYDHEFINEDTEFTVELTIPQHGVGEYKVMRNDEVVIDQTVPYEEGE